jgi:hypothetical protein
LDGRRCHSESGKRLEVERWVAVGGGVDTDGRVVGKPSELTRAETILALCTRFGCLPSELGQEDAELFRLLELERLGQPQREASADEQ